MDDDIRCFQTQWEAIHETLRIDISISGMIILAKKRVRKAGWRCGTVPHSERGDCSIT
jgi:hypothetical protein